MRRNKCLLISAIFIGLNIMILFYLVILQHQDLNTSSRPNMGKQKHKKHQLLTIILQEFEEFENNLEQSIEQLFLLSDLIDVVVIGDKMPYPPIKHKQSERIKIVSKEPRLQTSIQDSRPENSIRSEFVLFLPDSVVISHFSDIKQVILDLTISSYSAFAIPVSNVQLTCQKLRFNVQKWTLGYSESESRSVCDIVLGNHGLLTRTETLLKFSHSFLRPLFTSFYVQNSLFKHASIHIYEEVQLQSLAELFQEPHARWKHKKLEDMRRQQMLKTLGVKLVEHGSGKTEWFGCTKETSRCFDTVVNDMPEYIYQGRWTPPCCLKALKETVHHVFKILRQCGARFWLEGGSLLGAARNGDIISWDYDVDIGIYRDDVNKCEQFKIDSKNSFIDEDGFLWEKAIEGEFYRVQYSETNRLHVDIYPFYSRNGTMTKNTWMKTHRQDTEFPESYLKPLTKIKFMGIDAPAPNHVKEFLEFKFGKGVIENPKYPNAQDVNS